MPEQEINIQARRAYQREYQRRRRAADPEYRERQNEAMRRWYERNRERQLEWMREYGKRRKDPRRYDEPGRRAPKIIGKAVKRGKLTRPPECEVCGVPCKPDAHHHLGHDQPYAVQWLCQECHLKAHGKVRRG